VLGRDALALIQQLEAQNAELKRERDAAVNDLTKSQFCHACKHCEEKEELAAYNDVPAQCVNCAFEVSQFLWRGPLPEPPKEEEK
jgi:tRNA G26 N,N-dimethylase Trm1